MEGLVRAGKCEVDMASLRIELTNWTICEARETKKKKKCDGFRSTEVFASSWDQLTPFPSVSKLKRWETTVGWVSGRHSDTGSKSVLGPTDSLSVSCAVSHSELRHGLRLLRTGLLPSTQLISWGPFKSNFTWFCAGRFISVRDSSTFPFKSTEDTNLSGSPLAVCLWF